MLSPGRQLNTAGYALFVPDVLHLICDLLELRDWMALMLTCKSTFTTAASHIWANLDGVKVLTDLLPESPCSEPSKSVRTTTTASFLFFISHTPH